MPRRLFILAGHSGVGKTTLLLEAYRSGVPLFGAELDPAFRATHRAPELREYNTFVHAWRHRSYFLALHLPRLRQQPQLPDNLLLHVDIRKVLSILSLRDVAPPDPSGLAFPRPAAEMLDPAVNDRLIARYLGDPFFGRFDEIHVATVFCAAGETYRRWAARDGEAVTGPLTAEFVELHSEVYRCWQAGLAGLRPTSERRIDLTGAAPG